MFKQVMGYVAGVLTPLALLAMVALAYANPRPPKDDDGGEVFIFCSEETGDGVYCGNGTDEYVLAVGRYDWIAVDFSQSTATTFDCDLIGANVPLNTLQALGATGQVMNSVPFSTSQKGISFSQHFRFAWVYCTTTTNGSVTATLYGGVNR